MAYLMGALILTASGQMAFKSGVSRSQRPLVIVGIAALGLAMVCSLFALRTLNIGFVYMATGLTHVLVLVGSRWILGEAIPRDRWTGAMLIIGGVLLYGLAS